MAKFRITKKLLLKPITTAAMASMRLTADYFNPVTIPSGAIVEGTENTGNGMPLLTFTFRDKQFQTLRGEVVYTIYPPSKKPDEVPEPSPEPSYTPSSIPKVPSIFTTKNVVLGISGIILIYGIYKLTK